MVVFSLRNNNYLNVAYNLMLIILKMYLRITSYSKDVWKNIIFFIDVKYP